MPELSKWLDKDITPKLAGPWGHYTACLLLLQHMSALTVVFLELYKQCSIICMQVVKHPVACPTRRAPVACKPHLLYWPLGTQQVCLYAELSH